MNKPPAVKIKDSEIKITYGKSNLIGDPTSVVTDSFLVIEASPNRKNYTSSFSVIPMAKVKELTRQYGDFRSCKSPGRYEGLNSALSMKLLAVDGGVVNKIAYIEQLRKQWCESVIRMSMIELKPTDPNVDNQVKTSSFLVFRHVSVPRYLVKNIEIIEENHDISMMGQKEGNRYIGRTKAVERAKGNFMSIPFFVAIGLFAIIWRLLKARREAWKMKKILLIDDEKDFCAVVKKRLELISDYRVIPAYSAKEGIRAAIWKKPDLILLDILLPDMGGLELLERIKKDTRTMSIPVIVLTAKEDDETKLNAAGLYDDDYIVKPVEMNILKSKIDNVLARKKPAPQ